MKIALDVTPLSNKHRVRGIGSYTGSLVAALKKYDKQNSYIFFTRGEKLPEKPDLVHYPYFEPFFLTLPLVKDYPTVVTVHDMIPLVFPDKFPRGIRGKVKWQIQRLSLKGAEAVVADSQCSKDDAIKFTGMDKNRVHVVYLAQRPEFREIKNTQLLYGIREKYNLSEDFILYVGDVNYSKNIPGLIRAFERIKSKLQKRNLKLVLIGKAFQEKGLRETQEIVKLTEPLGLTDEVIRLGFVQAEDLVAIYNLATVYCQPSFYEGFGLPVLEAMACGTPVVAAKRSSLPEIAGDAVFWVDPYDVDSIACGIEKVLKNKILKEQLTQKGLIQAKKFSWQKTAEETVKIYKQVNERQSFQAG